MLLNYSFRQSEYKRINLIKSSIESIYIKLYFFIYFSLIYFSQKMMLVSTILLF